MRDVYQCPSCYVNFYGVKPEFESFRICCGSLHGLAWLKQGCLWWPVKVFKWRDDSTYVYDQDYVDVKIFGDHLTTLVFC